MSAMSLCVAKEQFIVHLSAVEDAARYAFRRMRRQDPEEALAAACGAAWSAWAGLLRRGKDPVEVGVHAIARHAIKYVKSGRKLGNPTCGRGARDVWHPRVRRALGLRVVSFEVLAGPSPGSWRDWLVADHRVTPADLACSRLDFAAWLAGLPVRKRRVAELLAEGHEGVVVARLVGIAQSRVSQLRTELAESWKAFQAGGLRGVSLCFWFLADQPGGFAAETKPFPNFTG
jgi:hypothetical protein